MGDPTTGRSYEGWQRWAHPNSPAGDGGPGRFREARLLGSEPWCGVGAVHPLSPVGLIKAASRDAGSLAADYVAVLGAGDPASHGCDVPRGGAESVSDLGEGGDVRDGGVCDEVASAED